MPLGLLWLLRRGWLSSWRVRSARQSIHLTCINRLKSHIKSTLCSLLSSLISFDRLYCYAQKHVRSIKAVTKDPGEITEKRYRSIRRLNKPNKKLKIRNFHHSSPYHVSDHKAAITVGIIMGVFLGKPSRTYHDCLFKISLRLLRGVLLSRALGMEMRRYFEPPLACVLIEKQKPRWHVRGAV